MRLRIAAASAALVLCATAGLAACSSPPDTVDAERPAAPTAPGPEAGPAENAETGRGQAAPPELSGLSVAESEKCARAAADIAAECALDPSFAAVTEGERAAEPPPLP
ncbi:hypothetical protein ACFXOR_13770 [Streptomyces sp. NPDC059164]|uniref:hypothetical protein n=1 Tax=Streptomyces sp. NPDC059164 TaxID=3346750 RepID=UPI0036AD1604